MTNDQCIRLEMASGFEVIYYGATGKDCWTWVAHTKYKQFLAPTLYTYDQVITVGRYVRPSDTLPGHYFVDNGGLYVSEADGTPWIAINNPMQVLQVNTECRVVWMAYTAGDAIPAGAVLGGYTSQGTHSDIYVIKIMDETRGGYLFGYYDPSTKLGHIAVQGTHNMTHMDIMIILWVVRSNSCYVELFPRERILGFRDTGIVQVL